MAKLVKKEGAIATCPTCNKQMVCVNKDTQDGPKLQWQNDEGQSHYLPPTTNAEGKTIFACRGFTVQGQAPQNLATKALEADLSQFKAELVTKEEESLWYDLIAKTGEYAVLAQKKLQEYPELTNPALKGLITKVAFEVLAEFKKSQREGIDA
jgi:hypothetical protein